MKRLSSWGLLSAEPHKIQRPFDQISAVKQISHSDVGIAFGNGRSYGDAALNPNGVVWDTRSLDHILMFDRQQGRFCCESGVLLRDIQALIMPYGWMLPVTPGTQLITIGGAIANDVHGKNHHQFGSFGDHIDQIKVLRTNGDVIVCGPDNNQPWFEATLGGVGLTGVIIEATVKLRRIPGPWLDIETIPYRNLNEFFELADASETDWEHTVSWVDCTGGTEVRGLFKRGNFSEKNSGFLPKAKTKTMVFTPPISLVNGVSLRAFNYVYFELNKLKQGRGRAYYQSFLYPLDHVAHWNRIYGARGFYQYQCVVPRDLGPNAIAAMLGEIKRSGQGSFLTVLKTFGQRRSLGMLSFATPGVTLALDFPNKGETTLALMSRLDSLVKQANGRIYLAKDARMPRSLFEAGYPRLSEFLDYRDPGISSALSRRLID
jgi:FAD/FMN-containing dehydrogenase